MEDIEEKITGLFSQSDLTNQGKVAIEEISSLAEEGDDTKNLSIVSIVSDEIAPYEVPDEIYKKPVLRRIYFPSLAALPTYAKFEVAKIVILSLIFIVLSAIFLLGIRMNTRLKHIETILENAEIQAQDVYKFREELKFILDLKEDLGITSINPVILAAYAQNTGGYQEGDLSIAAKIVDPVTNAEYPINLTITKESNTKYLITGKDENNELTPGKYRLQVDMAKGGAKSTKTQDFSWGVLVINTNKSVYKPGELAKISMAVLDDKAEMVCDADVKLTITNPENKETILSTLDKTIKVNSGCNKKEMIIEPDFEADYQTSVIGVYKMKLGAITKNGENTIEDQFEVRDNIPFEIERITATRIYPPEKYPVTIIVKANTDYRGTVKEYVPWEFTITNSTEYINGYSQENVEQYIIWDVDWKAGSTYKLEYEYKAINKSPELYILGPLTIGDYMETREWQIAADAATAGEWWDTNYMYRQKITVTAGATAVPTAYSIKLPINHAGLVSAGKSLSSGDDIRIAYWNGSSWTELDRALGESYSWNNTGTRVWFKTQAAISASGSDDNYYLYYGYSSSTSPPANKNSVYSFWDDFNRTDSTSPGTSYTQTGGGTWAISSNTLRNIGNTGDPNKLLINTLGSAAGDVEMMAKIDVTAWGGTADEGRMGLSSHMTAAGAGYDGLFHNDQTSLDLLNDLLSWGTLGTFNWSTSTWYYMKFQVYNPSAKTGRASVWLSTGTDPGIWTVDGNFGTGAARTSGYVGMAGSRRNTDTTYFDDLWVRKLVNPEPTSAFSSEEKILVVSGTAYTNDDEASTLNSFTRVCIAKNSTDGGYCRATNGSGVFTIPVIDSNTGDQFTVFLDNAATHGNTVTKAGSSNISGLKVYQDHIVVRHDQGTALSISDMDAYDNDENATDMLFDADTAPSITLGCEYGTELFVQSGYTFQPGGNADCHDLEIDGTFDETSSYNINLDGTFKLDTSGVFNPSSSNLIMDGTGGTEDVITDGNGSLYNLQINDGGGSLTVEVEDPLTVLNNLTITGGTLDVKSGENNQINVAGNWTNDDIFVERSGTIVFDGTIDSTLDSGCANDATCTNENFYNLNVNKGQDNSISLTSTHLRITNLLNILKGILIQGALNIRAEGATAVKVDDLGRLRNYSTGDITLGGNVLNDGEITLNANGAACGDNDDITISSTAASNRTWSGVGGFRLTDVTASYQTGSAVIHVGSGTDSGNNAGEWAFVNCNIFEFTGLNVEGTKVD